MTHGMKRHYGVNGRFAGQYAFERAMQRRLSSWWRGALGEALNGYLVLRDLTKLGYFALFDVQTRAGNLDIVLIGPAGVVVIDVKTSRKFVRCDGERILVGKRSRPFIDRLREQLLIVASRLRPRFSFHLHGFIAFANTQVERLVDAVGYIRVVEANVLCAELQKLPAILSRTSVLEIVQAASTANLWLG